MHIDSKDYIKDIFKFYKDLISNNIYFGLLSSIEEISLCDRF